METALRIALITSSYPRHRDDSRNAGVFVREVAERLTAAGADVLVLTPHRVVPDRDRAWRVISFWWPGKETSLTHLNPRHPLSALRLGLLILSGLVTSLGVFSHEPFDYAVCAWAVPSALFGWAGKRLFGVRYGVWALGSDIWRRRDYPLGRTLVGRVLRNAETLYADGLALGGEVEAIAGKPCLFLPASRALPSAGPARSRDGRPMFLCVARLHRHKGVDVLIEAVGQIPAEDRRGMTFEIFGDGPEGVHLMSRAAELGLNDCVHFGGYLDASGLAMKLQTAACLVMPSRVESIPVLLSDAVQANCPIIATDVGDVGALLREYHAGAVVQPESPSALADSLIHFSQHGFAQSSRAGELAAYLSVERSVAQILSDARAAADSRAPRPGMSTRLRTVRRLLTASLLLLASWLIWREAARNLADRAEFRVEWHARGVALGLLAMALAFLTDTRAWWRMMNAQLGRRELTFAEAFAAQNASAILKFIPGRIWHYGAQAVWLRHRNIGPWCVIYVNVVCASASLWVSLVFGAVYVLRAFDAFMFRPVLWLLVPLALAVGAAIGPRLIARLVSTTSRFAGQRLAAEVIPGRLALEVTLLSAASAVLAGLGVSAAALGVGLRITPIDVVTITASFSLSWGLSNLVAITPSGLGVREGVMFLALNGAGATHAALIVPIVSRLLSTAIEVLLAGTGFAIGRRAGLFGRAPHSA